jgi:ribose 5-phosphate isomerase B
MKLSIGSDHAGYNYKQEIIKYLEGKGHTVIDCGTNSLESCDYPIFGRAAAEKVANKEVDFGILVCSSGEGIMMTANKVKGVRAGLAYNDDVARLIRQHNNANMIAFGANFMKLEDVLRRIDIFLSTDFEGGRHERRVNEIE